VVSIGMQSLLKSKKNYTSRMRLSAVCASVRAESSPRNVPAKPCP
jgi:hypothetical protein